MVRLMVLMYLVKLLALSGPLSPAAGERVRVRGPSAPQAHEPPSPQPWADENAVT
jgi:hypothetical protein